MLNGDIFSCKTSVTGPNLDLLCGWQSDAARFSEKYAKLYFDAKHLEKRFNWGL